MKIALRFLIVLFFISGCEVRKRKYTKGFAVDHLWHSQQGHENDPPAFKTFVLPPDSCATIEFNDGTKIKARVVSDLNNEIVYLYCDGDNTEHRVHHNRVTRVVPHRSSAESRAGTNIPTSNSLPVTKSVTLVADSSKPVPATQLATQNTTKRLCDVIVYRDGAEDSVIIREIGISEIKFKTCDMPDGPDFVRKKADVFMLKFANGKKELIKLESIPAEVKPQVVKPYVETKTALATLSMTMSALGFWPLTILGSILGVVFGSIYLRDHARDPERYPNAKIAKAGMVTGIVTLSLALFIILLIAFL